MKANLNKNRSSIIRKENSRSDLLFEEQEKEKNCVIEEILMSFCFISLFSLYVCDCHRAILNVYREVSYSSDFLTLISIHIHTIHMFRWMEWCICTYTDDFHDVIDQGLKDEHHSVSIRHLFSSSVPYPAENKQLKYWLSSRDRYRHR